VNQTVCFLKGYNADGSLKMLCLFTRSQHGTSVRAKIRTSLEEITYGRRYWVWPDDDPWFEVNSFILNFTVVCLKLQYSSDIYDFVLAL
jgi:hypothetical protein